MINLVPGKLYKIRTSMLKYFNVHTHEIQWASVGDVVFILELMDIHIIKCNKFPYEEHKYRILFKEDMYYVYVNDIEVEFFYQLTEENYNKCL